MATDVILAVGCAFLCGLACALAAAWVLCNVGDANRAVIWRRRFETLGDAVQDSFFGRWFDATWGTRLGRRSLAKYVESGNRQRALAVALRYGLVTEGAEMVAAQHDLETAAEFATAAGDTSLARRLFRRAHDVHCTSHRFALAAAAAEAAGAHDLAVRAWRLLPDDSGVLRSARVSERMGRPRAAMESYLDAGAGGDALRVAETHGLLSAFCDAVERRDDAALWRTGAEAAVRAGHPARGVELARRAGDLELCRSIAQQAGLAADVRAADAGLRERREAERRDPLYGHGHRHFQAPAVADSAPPRRPKTSETGLLCFAE